jgi:lipoprotein-releasing system permease protein
MTPYAIKLASRHLAAHKGQTALLMTGVALGVSVFIFMSALIGGLSTLLTLRTVGNIPHIVLEMPDRDPAILSTGDSVQVVSQKDLSRRDQIAIWQPLLPVIEQTEKIIAVSPQIRGSAYIERGQALAPVGVIGVMPDQLSAISDIEAALVEGSANLPADGILIGSRLAQDLGLRVGQVISLSSDRDRTRSFRIGGIYTLGVASADRQTVYMNFNAARAIFDLESGISRIEIRVNPATDAAEIAEQLRRSTQLKATAWTEDNSQLFEALDAQGRTGSIIKAFALITIIVGISSASLLSIMRRQAEIGIMRAMGASKTLILWIFVIEGTLIGFVGAVIGAGLAWAALSPFPPVADVQGGGLPIDREQGNFLIAILLTTVAAMIASILPARKAARIDPVEAIGS